MLEIVTADDDGCTLCSQFLNLIQQNFLTLKTQGRENIIQKQEPAGPVKCTRQDQNLSLLVGQVGGPGPGPSAGGGGGLVNLNTASPEALEALPGIGPVTVQKIVAARQERPFATLEELVERQVMNRGQLEDIRDLVTL